MGIYDKIFKPKKLVLSDGKVVEEKRTRTPLVLLLLLIATVISVRITGFSLNTILTRGNQFFVILGQMFPPKTGYLSSIWGPLLDTIKMSLLGSFAGGVLAIPFAILASSNLVKNKVVLGVVRIFLSIVRTILKKMRTTPRTTLFLTRLLDAKIANGIARTPPAKEPSSDILIVSKSGPQILLKYPVFGGNICPNMTKN